MPIPFNIRGHTKHINVGTTNLLFKSISAVSTTFAIEHTGTDDPIWSDGTDTYQPVKAGNISTVTFVNWNDATEKTVNVTVNDNSEVLGLSDTEFINKGLTYVDLSVCTGYKGHINLKNNANLQTVLFPITTSRLAVGNDLVISDCDLLSIDLSQFFGVNRGIYDFRSNINLNSFMPPINFDDVDRFQINDTGLTSLNISALQIQNAGTHYLFVGGCPNLVTINWPTLPNDNLQSFNVSNYADMLLVAGEIDLSQFVNIGQIYLNTTSNTACTNIILPSSLSIDFFMENFTNATVDASGFYMNGRLVRIQNMPAVTTLAWSSASPTTTTAGGSSFIRNMASLTGVLDISFHKGIGFTITGCPLVTGLIFPGGLSGNYANNTFSGFNTGFYMDFTVWPGIVKASNNAIDVSNNNMTSEQVNHILVDLAAHVSSEAEGGDYTGRSITINGNNSCVNQTSGGYNGIAAMNTLIDKGFTVNANVCAEAMVFKSTNDVSSDFAIVYAGTGTPYWDDGIGNGLTGTSVTFPWTTTAEKTVTLSVDQNDQITRVDYTLFSNKNLTYVSLAALSGFDTTNRIAFYTNPALTEFIHPPSGDLSSRLYLYDTGLTGDLDLSHYTNLSLITFYTTGITTITPPSTIYPNNVQDFRVNDAVIGDIDLNAYGDSYANNLTIGLGIAGMTSLTWITGVTATNSVTTIGLANTTLTVPLDLSFIDSPGVGNLQTNGSAFTEVIFPTSGYLGGFNKSIYLYSMTGLTNTVFDFSNQSDLGGKFRIHTNGLTDIIWPSITLGVGSFNDINISNNNLGYIDFTTMINVTEGNGQDFVMQDNGWTSDIVNHILVDLDGMSSGSYTGRTINFGSGGTNECANINSGGYDGLAAITSLVSKGFVVTCDQCVADLILKSVAATSTQFIITYGGTGTAEWTDGVDTYTGNNVTFVNWNDASEKTVTVVVDEPGSLTGIGTLTSKDITEIDLSLLPNLSGQLNLSSNTSLTTIVHPPDTNTVDYLNVYNTNLPTTLDLSNYSYLSSLLIPDSNITTLTYPTNPPQNPLLQVQVSRSSTGFYNHTFSGTLYLDQLFNGWATSGSVALYAQSNTMSALTFPSGNTSYNIATIALAQTTISQVLDLSFITGGGITSTLNLTSSDFTNIIWPTGGSMKTVNANIMGLTGGATWDLSNITSLNGIGYNFSSTSGLTSITWPTLVLSTAHSIKLFAMNSCTSLGYVDLSTMTNYTHTDDLIIQFSGNSSLSVADVNHILVDADSDADSSYTGRELNLGSTQTPDGSSGGYDGLTAASNLVTKGFTVIY